MATPVSLALKAEGISEVTAALRGVKQEYVSMERESVAASRDATKQRIALLKEESKAKIASFKEVSQARMATQKSETEFRRTIGRSPSESGFGAAGSALMKGEGFSGMLKAAGVAGLAVGVFSSAINFASTTLKQFGAFLINDVIKPGMELETKATQIANNSGGALSAADVQDRAKAIGLQNNMDPMKVLEATSRFQDLTGESKMGFDIVPLLATISKGRPDMDPKTLAEMSASFYRPGMQAKDMNQMMLTLTGQGEKGAIPIGELAKLGGRLTAPAEKMGGDWFTKVTTANALLQGSRVGFGSSESTAEGFADFMKEGSTKGKRFSKSFARVNGVDTMLDPVKVISDIYRKTGGNNLGEGGAGFSAPAAKFIEARRGTYSKAFEEAKAGGKNDTQAMELGAQAVENFYNSLKTATSTLGAESAKRDAVMQTSGEKFASVMGSVTSDLQKELEPTVRNLAATFADSQDTIKLAFTELASGIVWIVDNMMDASRGLKKFLLSFAEEGSVVGFEHKDTKRALTTPTDLMGKEVKGYWKTNEAGDFQYIKSDKAAPEGDWKRAGKTGTLVYQGEAKAPEAVASYGSPEPRDSYDPLTPKDENSTPSTGPAGEAGTGDTSGADAAAGAHQELADSATAAKEALDAFTSKLEDANSSVGGMNRTKSFMEQ